MATSTGAHRAVLLANYILMFMATFTFGLFSLFAVILAYLRRGGADPVSRSHYDFQIKSFWHDVGLIIVGALCGYLAIAGGVGAFLGITGVHLPFGLGAWEAGWIAFALAIVWAVLWIWGFINLIIDSVRGMLMLAAGKPMGKTRPL
jgi:uncharacterized membrane protein